MCGSEGTRRRFVAVGNCVARMAEGDSSSGFYWPRPFLLEVLKGETPHFFFSLF